MPTHLHELDARYTMISSRSTRSPEASPVPGASSCPTSSCPAVRYAFSGVLIGLLLSFMSVEAQAQRFGQVEETESNIDSYYYYVQPGAATIEIKVMGTVRNPGLYRLSEGTDLGQLLALAGGPTLDVRLRSRPRTATVRLYRPQAQGQALLYEAEFEQNLAAESENYPALQDGDILTVEVTERQRLVWRDLFTIANTVAVIALAIERLAFDQ